MAKPNEHNKEGRKIITRAFVTTGKDGIPSLLLYIDMLEDALLRMDRDIHDRKQKKPRYYVRDILRY